MVFELSGVKNAIKEGTTTVQEVFKSNTADAEKMAADASKKAEDNRKRADEAIAAATGAQTQALAAEPAPADVNPETGEIIENPNIQN